MRHRAALVVTHPGHEVLLHGWLELAKPVVFVLTDGCDAGGYSAIGTTARTLQNIGSQAGRLFGRCSEPRLLQAVIQGDHERIFALAEELADAFITDKITFVVADPAEGRHPSHDLCRLLTDTAVTLAARHRPELRNYEYSLYPAEPRRKVVAGGKGFPLSIEGTAWQRKFSCARTYPACLEELWQTIQHHGLDSLREEYLRPAMPWGIMQRTGVSYSRAGDRLPIPDVGFHEHLLPAAEALRRHAAGKSVAAA
jgi:hypothetical protein